MMATRLTDSELAQRVRAGNRVRAQRQQERRRAAGLVQLNIWIDATTKTALTAIAAATGDNLNDTAERLLSAALTAPAPVSTPPSVDAPVPKPTAVDATLELFGEPATPAANYRRAGYLPEPPTVPTGREALMLEIGELLAEGHSGADIARRLNASGRRTASGAEFNGANVLRDFRRWQEKTGTVDITRNSK